MSHLPPSQSGRSPLEVATQAAREAGQVLLSNFHQPTQARSKGRGNLVTEADLLSESTIAGLLRKEYPSWGIISEESEDIPSDSGYTWIIDPLDGTNNYSFGIPFFSVNVALTAGGEVVLGLTYDPVRQELFRAETGKGAFLNDAPISVSSSGPLDSCVIGFDMGYEEEGGRESLEVARSLWRRLATSLRVMGSAALGLAYTAGGRINLYFHRRLYPWDLASGLVLVREAGGLITDWQAKPATPSTTQVIAASPALHGEFMRLAREQARQPLEVPGQPFPPQPAC